VLLDFVVDRIKEVPKFQALPKQQRLTALGQLRSGSAVALRSASIFLERAGIVTIDWDHHCNCGVCDPEPKVDLVMPDDG